jgi:hypothetical protein
MSVSDTAQPPLNAGIRISWTSPRRSSKWPSIRDRGSKGLYMPRIEAHQDSLRCYLHDRDRISGPFAGLQREFETKPNCFNKSTTVKVRRTFISYYLPPMSIHIWQLSYHHGKVVRELFGGDASHDLFPLLFEGTVVQGDTHQFVLHAPKQKKVRRSQIQQ